MYSSQKMLSEVDERKVWAIDVTMTPPDPNVKIGRVIVTKRTTEEPAYIRSVPPMQTPILKKQENEEVVLLKRILQGLQPKSQVPMPGLPVSTSGPTQSMRVHAF
jgi:hypothetical protein